jgi:hypothetical protein
VEVKFKVGKTNYVLGVTSKSLRDSEVKLEDIKPLPEFVDKHSESRRRGTVQAARPKTC